MIINNKLNNQLFDINNISNNQKLKIYNINSDTLYKPVTNIKIYTKTLLDLVTQLIGRIC